MSRSICRCPRCFTRCRFLLWLPRSNLCKPFQHDRKTTDDPEAKVDADIQWIVRCLVPLCRQWIIITSAVDVVSREMIIIPYVGFSHIVRA